MFRSGVSGDVYGHWASNSHEKVKLHVPVNIYLWYVQGVEEPHPGIAPPGPGESLTYHKYYQWVIFFFFIQGVMFYLPRLFWKHAEGGLMKNLVGGLTDPLIPYKV